MLQVLKPMAHIPFSVTESQCTLTFTFTLHIFTFVNVTVLVDCLSFSIGAPSFQLAGIFRTVLKFVISQRNLGRSGHSSPRHQGQ